jgi:glycosyltransferase involved in cell wall biosynthesis
LELARDLAASGAEVSCTALEGMNGPMRERCADYGIAVVDLGLPKLGPLSRNGLSVELVRRLRELKFDTIHLQHFLGLHKLGLPARLAGISRIAITEHSVLDASQSAAGRFRIRLDWRLAHVITVICPNVKEYLVQALGVDAARIHVVPVGVDVQNWRRDDRSACRARLGIGDEFVFAYAGRLAPVKDTPGLIASFLSMQASVDAAARLLLIGDGEDMAQCQKIAAVHPRGSAVTFVGEQSDIRPYLAAADAFVLNSKSEGTPRALLEAMAMGLPGVSTAVGGIPELLVGRGWLTQPGDAASLCDAMVDAVRSPEKVKVFGALAARYVAEHHDAKRILPIYRELLSLADATSARSQ